MGCKNFDSSPALHVGRRGLTPRRSTNFVGSMPFGKTFHVHPTTCNKRGWVRINAKALRRLELSLGSYPNARGSIPPFATKFNSAHVMLGLNVDTVFLRAKTLLNRTCAPHVYSQLESAV